MKSLLKTSKKDYDAFIKGIENEYVWKVGLIKSAVCFELARTYIKDIDALKPIN